MINKGKEISKGELTDIKKKFGGNHIKLGFEGNFDFIKNDRRVLHFEIFNNFAEIQLEDSVKPTEYLKSIVDSTSVSHFSIIEPSLNKIFIDLVRQSSGAKI